MLGILPGLHSNKCVGIDSFVEGGLKTGRSCDLFIFVALLRVEGWFLEKPGRVIDWTLTCASTLAQPCDRLVGRGGLELGDGLGALGDSVFA